MHMVWFESYFLSGIVPLKGKHDSGIRTHTIEPLRTYKNQIIVNQYIRTLKTRA